MHRKIVNINKYNYTKYIIESKDNLKRNTIQIIYYNI